MYVSLPHHIITTQPSKLLGRLKFSLPHTSSYYLYSIPYPYQMFTTSFEPHILNSHIQKKITPTTQPQSSNIQSRDLDSIPQTTSQTKYFTNNFLQVNSAHMDTNHKLEHVLKVPNVIEICNLDQRTMDAYVDAFQAPQHGYRIRIGNWHAGSHLCHYECYRSGFPPGGPNKIALTKSLRIGCPFRMDARFLPKTLSWLLIHTHIAHNHPADPNVKSCKKSPAKDPILPHPYHLTPNTSTNDDKQQTTPVEPQQPNRSGALLDSTFLTQPACVNSIDSTILTLPAQLQALTPRRQLKAVQSIEVILAQQEASVSIPIYHQQANLHLSLNHDCTSNSPKTFTPGDTHFQPKSLLLNSEFQPPQSPTTRAETPLDNLVLDSLIDDFYGQSEQTASTFNFEDLICQPMIEAQQPESKADISPLIFHPANTETKQTPSDIEPLASSHIPKIEEPSQPQLTTCDQTSQTSPTAPIPIMTCRRARELSIGQKTHKNTELPTLLKRYQIHKWLIPFVLNLHEVKADGHCGFRAIALSIGRSQDDWLYVRQALATTLKKTPELFADRSLHDTHSVALTRLRTREHNVLTQEKHWLSMPGWGGVIATAFDRPVLYYEPGSFSQTTFPYLTPFNNNRPIVLAWANRHFACLTLDWNNPDLPVPRVCSSWMRFWTPEASGWLDAWDSRIKNHEDFLKAQKPRHNKKKKFHKPITLSSD
ncbi:uncharacterized protein MELLADRAFT_111259 [Melampsora larici-populina 98AG31]|uniref:OTU domain-containing protein n=1 Tax=Melampsora larici-populina (strain 98AG31 / pathotype 3-4-7) TaxID=747676 RepID=F4S2W0_MELLP|nr:uncharacterized protein MELLADRAFT_111259 [Melampsora larici-populina 98AG31]EGG01011.1 hypothetical protein MELLADRAFT_111259 [Melampsora larici-populina 98AG31]